MNFEERCRLSEQCLPEAPYKEMLTKLHDEMLEALAQPTTGDYALGYAEGFNDACKKPAQPPIYEQEPVAWRGLTGEEIITMSRYDLEYAALIGEVQRKLKEKNT